MKNILLTSLCVAAVATAWDTTGARPKAILATPIQVTENIEPPADAAPEPPAAPENPAPAVLGAPDDAVPAARAGTRNSDDGRDGVVKRMVARRQAESAQREAELIQGEQAEQMGAFERLNMFTGFRHPGQEGRSLVIRFSETDPKTQAAAEEDLNVMARILNKSLAKKGGEEPRQAMGVLLTSSSGGVKNMLIEGYGAIFMLRANFPLAGAPAKTVEEKPKEPGNSTWDEAKQELYGGTRRPSARAAAPKVAFDPKRVDELKDSLLEALKNASNIRSLKENEFVTVVVNSGEEGGNSFIWHGSSNGGGGSEAPHAFSTSNGNTVVASGGGSGGGGGFGGSGGSYSGNYSGSSSGVVTYSASGEDAERARSAGHGATLTIRAKKSDIDAFFKGKMSSEDFHKKAQTAIY